MVSQDVRRLGSSLVALSVFSAILASCGPAPRDHSEVDVVNLPQTSVKWQSIGNCWAYAGLGWVESMVLSSSGESINFSESYHTYRHFETQLKSKWPITELETSGLWYTSINIFRTYGLMLEGDFIPEEAESTKSTRQALALSRLNEKLKDTKFRTSRTEQDIRDALDEAFGVKLAAIEGKIKHPNEIRVKADPAASSASAFDKPADPSQSLASQLDWKQIFHFEKLVPHDSASLPANPSPLSPQTQSMLQRVKEALNDGHPVVMNWFVDFNAMDQNGIFSLDQLRKMGPGTQGYHQTVIEDYAVKGIDPATGREFVVMEGEASPEEKTLAALHGEILYFVVKNSWGGEERSDRSSYLRDGTKGYHRLEANYLFGSLPKMNNGAFDSVETGLKSFILPANY